MSSSFIIQFKYANVHEKSWKYLSYVEKNQSFARVPSYLDLFLMNHVDP